jgi:hypothetical protein
MTKIYNYTLEFKQGTPRHTFSIDNVDIQINDTELLELVKFLLDNSPKVQSIVKEMTQ